MAIAPRHRVGSSPCHLNSTIVRLIPCRLPPDHPQVPAVPGQVEGAAVMGPESQPVTVGDPGDAEGREQELSQVLPAPAIGPASMLAQAVQVDQGEPVSS